MPSSESLCGWRPPGGGWTWAQSCGSSSRAWVPSTRKTHEPKTSTISATGQPHSEQQQQEELQLQQEGDQQQQDCGGDHTCPHQRDGQQRLITGEAITERRIEGGRANGDDALLDAVGELDDEEACGEEEEDAKEHSELVRCGWRRHGSSSGDKGGEVRVEWRVERVGQAKDERERHGVATHD